MKDYGLSGMTIAGMSGVDTALWDIIGKACDEPIHRRRLPHRGPGLRHRWLFLRPRQRSKEQFVDTGEQRTLVRDAAVHDVSHTVTASMSKHVTISLNYNLKKLYVLCYSAPDPAVTSAS